MPAAAAITATSCISAAGATGIILVIIVANGNAIGCTATCIGRSAASHRTIDIAFYSSCLRGNGPVTERVSWRACNTFALGAACCIIARAGSRIITVIGILQCYY
jgi:hypothetical protein